MLAFINGKPVYIVVTSIPVEKDILVVFEILLHFFGENVPLTPNPNSTSHAKRPLTLAVTRKSAGKMMGLEISWAMSHNV